MNGIRRCRTFTVVSIGVGLCVALGAWVFRDEFADATLFARSSFSTLVNDYERLLLNAGLLGPVYLFLIYLVTTVFMLPLWGFHVTTGYAYGTFRAVRARSSRVRVHRVD